MSPTSSTAPDLHAIMQEVAQQTYPSPALYVVATPIGNVGDLTLRAVNILARVNAVACEDTRMTGQLLARYGLAKELIAAHEHNEREAAQHLIERLSAGQCIALVSDAGTPAVSDPGARLVDAVRSAGLRVIPVPGASAALAALSASGFVNDRFHFVGFLPARHAQRETALRALLDETATLVIYEAPHRIEETIDSLAAVFEPQRRAVFARELTKLFEEIHRCTLAEAKAWLAGDANRHRGEYAIVVEGAPARSDADQAEAERVLRILLAECPVKQAAALAARITGGKKNALYERALQIRDAQSEEGSQAGS
jgi:16S rRNA (cytidine1402-2'-O)-methyltransferase